MREYFFLLIMVLPSAMATAGIETESLTMSDPRTREAALLMSRFAERTGLTSGQTPQRYLWTDAFAVCNYLGLARATGDETYTRLALQLVDQVHHTLGRHRDDDSRTGWISGLSETDGQQHPTRGGLRIGKSLPERAPGDSYDERLEWDRDGQYFHYLTKWMHALDQLARNTRQSRFSAWAGELAHSAFTAFSYLPSPGREPRRMYWKMSIDLTRPLVPSMGQHDPLDGYITTWQIHSTLKSLPQPGAVPDLEETGEGFATMYRQGNLATPDPLGLGGLLVDAWRVRQLTEQGTQLDAHLLDRLLDAALTGLRYYARSGELRQPARYRLAFRELGLSIGLHALERMQQAILQGAESHPGDLRLRARIQDLVQYLSLRDEIESYWRNPVQQQAATWIGHQDINEVMLATSLAPDGFLELLPPE